MRDREGEIERLCASETQHVHARERDSERETERERQREGREGEETQ